MTDSAKKAGNTVFTADGVTVTGLECFELDRIFDCGQCFRFERIREHCWEGVAFGRAIRFHQPSPDTLLIPGVSEEEYRKIWRPYLSLDVDYNAKRRELSARFAGHPTMTAAMEFGKGIRILRQDPWETVCSFIVSQNNNIPRIKKIIRALCEAYGEPLDGGQYAFPTPQSLAAAGREAIFNLRTGFRAKYIYDAASRVADGRLNLAAVEAADASRAAEMLCEVSGIGPKVAACALLFGFGKTEAFPVDVWMKRSLERHFPDGFDAAALGPLAGLAQQYLFYYERYHPENG